MSRATLGRMGEEHASLWLMDHGFRIEVRNWRVKLGELDIVARQGETLVFVEVRTRRLTGRFGTGEESIDYRKQRKVRELATLYLQAKGFREKHIRFDVIVIDCSLQGEVQELRHYEGAF